MCACVCADMSVKANQKLIIRAQEFEERRDDGGGDVCYENVLLPLVRNVQAVSPNRKIQDELKSREGKVEMM